MINFLKNPWGKVKKVTLKSTEFGKQVLERLKIFENNIQVS